MTYNVATIHLEQGNDEEAIPYYRETLRVEQAALGRKHKAVLETMEHIARVHQQRGELDQALKYYLEVLDIQQSAPEVDAHACAKTLNNIGNIFLQWGKTSEMMQAMSESLRYLRLVGEAEDELVISGFNFYGLAQLHPECAPVA